MVPFKSFVLVLTLTYAVIVSCDEKSETGFTDVLKEKVEKGVQMAKDGFAKAEEAFGDAKDKILQSNFTKGVKEKFNAGVDKAQEVLTNIKDTVTSHVSPVVSRVRTGMLDGVRNLREKLNKKKGSGDEGKEASEKKDSVVGAEGADGA